MTLEHLTRIRALIAQAKFRRETYGIRSKELDDAAPTELYRLRAALEDIVSYGDSESHEISGIICYEKAQKALGKK